MVIGLVTVQSAPHFKNTKEMRYTAKGKAMAWLDFRTMKPVETGFYLLFQKHGTYPFVHVVFYDSDKKEFREWDGVLSLSGSPLTQAQLKTITHWAKITDPTD